MFAEKYIQLKILEALVEIKKHGPVDENHAICGNVYEILFDSVGRVQWGELTEVLFEAFRKWNGYSGDQYFPVGGEAEFSSERGNSSYWKNPKRLDLLHFLIDYFEKELE